MTQSKDTGVVNIRGKEYETVALRVQKFRENHADYSLTTEIVCRDDSEVVMRASIRSPDGRELASGYAEEKRTASKINQTSALENCETSAIGRALAAYGLGGTEYATANEVQGAIEQQDGMRDALLNAVVQAIEDDDPAGFLIAIKADENTWTEVFSRSLNSKQKSAARDLEQRGVAMVTEYAEMVQEAVQREDAPGLAEAFSEMSEGMKRMVWARLDQPTKDAAKQLKEQSQ